MCPVASFPQQMFQFSPSKRKDYHTQSRVGLFAFYLFQFSPSKRKDYHIEIAIAPRGF